MPNRFSLLPRLFRPAPLAACCALVLGACSSSSDTVREAQPMARRAYAANEASGSALGAPMAPSSGVVLATAASQSQRNTQLWAQWSDDKSRRSRATRVAANEPPVVERNFPDERAAAPAPAPRTEPAPTGPGEQIFITQEDMRGTVAIRRAPAR